MMRNGTLTVLARVSAARRTALQQRLDTLERDATPIFPWVPGLHFARLAMLDCPARGGGGSETYLLLAADYVSDRPPRELDAGFLDDLFERLGQGAAARRFEEILQHCEDFPGLADREAARAFLLERRKGYSARHVAFPYRWQTPDAIYQAVRLRLSLDARLDEMSGASPTPEQVRERVPRHGGTAMRTHLWSARLQAALATLNPLNALLTWRARRKAHAYERRLQEGPPIPGARWGETPRFARRRIAPDGQVQNPLTQVVPLEVGWLGAWLLRLRLALVNVRLRRYLVGLNRLQGIHFARWVVFKAAGRHHLLFLSCFDGTWDGYIGAFFEDLPVRALLEDMWNGSERFAEARTLDAFKSWILARQVPTSVFYSAHRAQQLGVADIHQALQVRALIEGTRPAEELAAYMRSGTCEPEVRQLSLTEAFTEIGRALRNAWVKETSDASVAAVRWGGVPGDVRRAHRGLGSRGHSAAGYPRVPTSGGLPVSRRRAWLRRRRQGVVER